VDDQREIHRWAMYSFANHGWVTTVGTVLIGPWLLALGKKASGSNHATLFDLFGWHLSAAAYPSFVLAVAALLQVLTLPALGASADALSAKKRLLFLTCAMGSLTTALLATTGGSMWLYAGILFLLGNLIFGATDLMSNAFLAQIASPGRRNAASSHGFAIGYLGAGLLLTLNLALLKVHGSLGISKATAVRICFLQAALWWLLIGFWAISGLTERGAVTGRAGHGFGELRDALRQLRAMPNAFRYLLAYLFYSDAISAVIGLSSTYITHELYNDSATRASTFLFELILLIQFIAIGGSLLFARAARIFGTKRTIVIALVIWCFVIIYAYVSLRSKAEAIAMGVVLALVLGGSQALSRALYAQMIPRGREATFFGLYEICDKGTSWMAPLLFTLVVNETGSFRQAILSLIALFLIGLILLLFTDTDRAQLEAAAAA
jgi:UMF1 family MFS transporter